MVDKIDTPCPAYDVMMRAWQLPQALYGGTRSMREAGETWLPKEDKEDISRYSSRLYRSVLHNAYRSTLRRLSGKPFSKAVQIKTGTGEVPEPIDRMLKIGVDKRKRTLTQFCRPFFETGMHYGLVHILTDYPQLPEGKATSLKFDRENAIRPIFSIVSPADLIYWDYAEGTYGDVGLKEIRIKSQGYESGTLVQKIRVYRPGLWADYRKAQGDSEYVQVAQGVFSLNYIPLRTLYINETDVMCGEPALEDLAWQNLAHWQSYSDQRNILRVARIASLFFSGMSKAEIQKNINSVGPNAVWFSENKDAKGGYVEHSGAAISAGRDDIHDIEARMEVLGMQPLVERSGDMTATGKAIDEGNNVSDMQVWTTDCQSVIRQAFEDAYAWIGQDLPEDFGVDIFQDFNLAARYVGDMQNLAEARRNNWITSETYLREVKRRGLLAEHVNIETEVEDAKQQEQDFGFSNPQFGGFGR